MEWINKYKKIFLIAAFVLAVFVMGYLLYVFFFKPAAAPPAARTPEASGTDSSGGLPKAKSGTGQIIPSGAGQGGLLQPEVSGQPAASPTAQGGLTQTSELTRTPGLGATLAADGAGLLYYNKQDGKFYRLAKDGQPALLSDQVFHEVQKITWSPDKNKAILEYPDQAKIIYDFKNNKQISLPSHWQNFSFSPDGSKIVMKSLGNDPANRWLAVINSQGASAQRVAALGDNEETVYPSWSPNNQSVAMYTEGQNYDQQSVYFVGLNQENFKSLTIDGRGFSPKWSPQGDRLLYSVYSSASGLKPELWLANAQGESIGSGRVKLGIETWADKCVFANSADLYCAVPDALEEGAGLFPELARSSNDSLYKIDTRTGLKKLIALPDGRFSMTDLLVSDNGYYLYFTDANTERINKIKLK